MFQKLVFAVLFAARTSAAYAQDHSVAMPLLTSRIDPKEFGTQDDTITVVSALAFSASGYHLLTVSPSAGAYCNNCDISVGEFYAPLDIPAGAVIDYIGLNSATGADFILGVELWLRWASGEMVPLYGFSVPAHGWATDLAGPLGIELTTHKDVELVLNVEQAISPYIQPFGWVEVWWHRAVSPKPAAATFSDVPTTHQFFQFVEALHAAGITNGYPDGRFGVNDPITRGQMAVFLSVALGLHWPY